MSYNISHIISSMFCSDCNNSRISLSISHDRNVYSFGYSIFNAHGHNEENIIQVQQINGLSNIKMISGGTIHTVCLDYNGNVYTFGSNISGTLGIDKDFKTVEKTFIPQKINIPFITQIHCGVDFTVCLSDDGLLYSFGNNKRGQLGIQNIQNKSPSPQQIPKLNNIEYFICGGYHCICKSYDNMFYSWGYNDCGQLGKKTKKDINKKPILHKNWPNNIASIKCGLYHSLLLTLEGQIYGFGDNMYAQLGIDDKKTNKVYSPLLINNIPEIKRIECGNDHSICIDTDNNLWVFGANSFGQLGIGDDEDRYKPIKNELLKDIIDISSGGNHGFAKTSDNKIYAFGYNNKLQLGIKTSNEDQLTPIQVLQDNEEIWDSYIGKSRAKSARK